MDHQRKVTSTRPVELNAELKSQVEALAFDTGVEFEKALDAVVRAGLRVYETNTYATSPLPPQTGRHHKSSSNNTSSFTTERPTFAPVLTKE